MPECSSSVPRPANGSRPHSLRRVGEAHLPAVPDANFTCVEVRFSNEVDVALREFEFTGATCNGNWIGHDGEQPWGYGEGRQFSRSHKNGVACIRDPIVFDREHRGAVVTCGLAHHSDPNGTL